MGNGPIGDYRPTVSTIADDSAPPVAKKGNFVTPEPDTGTKGASSKGKSGSEALTKAEKPGLLDRVRQAFGKSNKVQSMATAVVEAQTSVSSTPAKGTPRTIQVQPKSEATVVPDEVTPVEPFVAPSVAPSSSSSSKPSFVNTVKTNTADRVVSTVSGGLAKMKPGDSGYLMGNAEIGVGIGGNLMSLDPTQVAAQFAEVNVHIDAHAFVQASVSVKRESNGQYAVTVEGQRGGGVSGSLSAAVKAPIPLVGGLTLASGGVGASGEVGTLSRMSVTLHSAEDAARFITSLSGLPVRGAPTPSTESVGAGTYKVNGDALSRVPVSISKSKATAKVGIPGASKSVSVSETRRDIETSGGPTVELDRENTRTSGLPLVHKVEALKKYAKTGTTSTVHLVASGGKITGTGTLEVKAGQIGRLATLRDKLAASTPASSSSSSPLILEDLDDLSGTETPSLPNTAESDGPSKPRKAVQTEYTRELNGLTETLLEQLKANMPDGVEMDTSAMRRQIYTSLDMMVTDKGGTIRQTSDAHGVMPALKAKSPKAVLVAALRTDTATLHVTMKQGADGRLVLNDDMPITYKTKGSVSHGMASGLHLKASVSGSYNTHLGEVTAETLAARPTVATGRDAWSEASQHT